MPLKTERKKKNTDIEEKLIIFIFPLSNGANSHEKVKLINTLFLPPPSLPGLDEHSYWLGARDIDQEGEFRWAIGDDLVPMGSPFWAIKYASSTSYTIVRCGESEGVTQQERQEGREGRISEGKGEEG